MGGRILQAESEFCRMLFERSTEGVVVAEAEGDNAGQIIAANEAMTQMHGYEREELLGKNIFELHTMEDTEETSANMQRMLQGEWVCGEHRHIKKDGTRFLAAYYAGTVRHHDKNYILSFTTDLTDLERLCESEERYRAAFEKSDEGVFILGAEGEEQGCILSVNEAGAAMHGYTPEEMMCMHISDVDTPEYAETIGERFEAIQRQGSDSRQIMHRRKDGSEFWVGYNAHLVEIGESKRVIAFIRDIMDQRHAQEELSSCREKLEAMI